MDTTRRPVRVSDWVALLDAVHSADSCDEQTWLEWKSTLDLRSKEQIATIVCKAIIAFANRDPLDASRTVGGVGILVVGLEPETVHGVAKVDNADLDQAISNYIGSDGPAWQPHWYAYKGKNVLIIEVHPPQWGDLPHTFRKSYDKIMDGQMFVRKLARSVPPDHLDVARLADRRARTLTSVGLEILVEVQCPTPLQRYELGDAELIRHLKNERERLLRPLRERRATAARAATNPIAGLNAAFDDLQQSLQSQLSVFSQASMKKEERTEDDFVAQVEAYLEAVKSMWPKAIRDLAAHRIAPPTFTVSNQSHRNLQGLEVRLHVDGDADAEMFDPDLARDLPDLLPKPPRPWGPYRLPVEQLMKMSFEPYQMLRSSGALAPVAPQTTIDRGGSFTLTFPPVDLRPHDLQVLEDEWSILVPATRNEPVIATWSATATNVDAKAEGQLTILFGGPDINLLRQPGNLQGQ